MTLAAPAFLPALLLLPGAVLALYLIRERRGRLLHPTLMFLARAETVLDASRLSPRLVATLLLLLDLLVASLLALALCRPALPFADRPGRATLLILDTSASTAARRPGGERAFDLLRERARGFIRAMGRADETALLTLDRRLRVVHPPTRDRSSLLAALERLAPGDAALSASAARDARRLLGHGTAEVATLLLTDGALPSGADPAALADRVEAFPGPFDNVGIIGISARRAADPADGFDVTLRLASTAAAREVDLELYGDGELVDARRVELPAGLSTRVLAGVRLKPGLLTALYPEGDDLPADDRASLLVAPDDLKFYHPALADPVVEAVFAALPDFAPAPGVTGAVHLSDGDGECPAAAAAHLAFLAEGDDGRPVANLHAPALDPDHPVTAGLESAEFLVGRGGFLAVPEGATVLVGTPEECLVWVGVRDGRMTARFGFLPAATNGGRRAFLPLLIARVARHVASYHARVESAGVAGEPFVVRGAGAPARVIDPEGGVTDYPAGGEIFHVRTDRAGVYRVETPEGATLVPLAAGSPEESLTLPRDVTTGALPERRGARPGALDLTPLFAFAALALLVGEWAVLRRSF